LSTRMNGSMSRLARQCRCWTMLPGERELFAFDLGAPGAAC
jgi:hypothetical protein